MHFSPFLIIILSDYYSLLVSFISPCALFYSLYVGCSRLGLRMRGLLLTGLLRLRRRPTFFTWLLFTILLRLRLGRWSWADGTDRAAKVEGSLYSTKAWAVELG
jgi:hypothetical protein